MSRLTLVLWLALSLAAASPSAHAAWAVAQPPGGEQPFSQRFRPEAEARQNALDACRAHFDNCKIIISGNSGCVAIATTGSKWGVGKGGNQTRAHDAAIKACKAFGDSACRIEYQFCGR